MDPKLTAILAEITKSVAKEAQTPATQLATLYYQHVLPKRVQDRLSVASAARFLLDRYNALESVPESGFWVNVRSPRSSETPGTFHVTTFETIQQDRPFILDSIREYIRRQGLSVQLTLHPVVTVERKGGRVIRVEDASATGPKESHIYMHLGRIEEPERLKALQDELTEVLLAVRGTVDAYPTMLEVLRNRLESTDIDIVPISGSEEWRREVRDFLGWLRDGNFIFMGYTRLRGSKGPSLPNEPQYCGIMDPSIGIPEYQKLLNAEVSRWSGNGKGRDDSLFIVKSDLKSIIHRADELDIIGIREYGHASDKPVGGSAFIGLFTTRLATERVGQMPIFRRKYREVLELLNFRPGSYDRKAAETILETIPKEEYTYFSAEEIKEEVARLVEVEGDSETSVVLRPTEGGKRFSPVFTLEKSNYSAALESRIRETFRQAFATQTVRHYQVWTEGELVRLHYYLTEAGRSPRERELEAIREELLLGVESWDHQLVTALRKIHDDRTAAEMISKFLPAFTDAYRSGTSVTDAITDFEFLRKLDETGEMQIGASDVSEEGRVVMTQLGIYSYENLELSALIPMMENLALNVNRQLHAELTFPDGRTMYVLKFWVRDAYDEPISRADRARRLVKGLRQVLFNFSEDDPLNKLILEADLDWWAANLFMTYRNYLCQGLKLQGDEVNQALVQNPAAVKAMFAYFDAKFNFKDTTPAANRDLSRTQAAFVESLQKVESIRQDRILRNVFNAIQATVRTNFYKIEGTDHFALGDGDFYLVGGPDFYVSVKLDSRRIDGLPDPKPLYEVYVHAVGMEGIHLRGGKVARGGIRWSDRPDDFRTEILGLMKTQMVKNAVIVPVGSKGGFVIKRPFPDARSAAREVTHQYRFLMRGLLDLTDNIVDGKVVHPEGVVVHDQDDPYLVVAADKGTANLSDVANEVSDQYRFWLGDAFASGGSRGYNHKEMGITAKGAWECAKRHFREMGIDAMQDPVRVVGIGDMAGDVFGNGLLSSPTMRLVGAFNHVHIFLDPDPKPEAFAERQRLFNLPRSTWKDFNASIISSGGGIFDRASKVIPLSNEIRTVLGTTQEAVNGEELIRLIMKADVDLLWNGGIGTYVKASTETHEQAGDKVNDPVRVDATEVRAKVIAEGGNLGLTARARTEYDLRGGRINTDATDNSAGVDTSDHEVNLKILTSHLISKGVIKDLEERDTILSALIQDVEQLVLDDNYWQALVIAMDRVRSREDVVPFIDLITTLTNEKSFDRNLERISADTDLKALRAPAQGIPRPQLSVLLSWSKMHLYDKLLAGSLIDHPYMHKFLVSYFPKSFAQQFALELSQHRLRREIIATVITNRIINQAGCTAVDRMIRETKKTADDAARAYIFANDLLGIDRVRDQILALDNKVATAMSDALLVNMENVLVRMAVNLLVNPPWPQLPLDKLEDYSKQVDDLRQHMSVSPTERMNMEQLREVQRFVQAGFPESLCHEIFTMRHMFPIPYLITMAQETKTSLADAFDGHYLVGVRLGFDQLIATLENIHAATSWERAFNEHLYHRLRHHKARLTKHVLNARTKGESVKSAFDRYIAGAADVVSRINKELEQIRSMKALQNAIPIFLFKDLYRMLPEAVAPTDQEAD